MGGWQVGGWQVGGWQVQLAVSGHLQEEQHSPSSTTGLVQLVGGQTIASHTTRPRWQLGGG